MLLTCLDAWTCHSDLTWHMNPTHALAKSKFSSGVAKCHAHDCKYVNKTII